jgi:hypothetical protein
MSTIDIALPDELTQALTPPSCLDLSLPKVASPDAASVTLPTGTAIQGMADLTRGIPTDCSLQLNLMLQLAPMMASMDCVLKILKFIGEIVKVLENFSPTSIASSVSDILSAAKDVLKCVGIAVPGPPECTFVKGLLKLIATMLLCVVTELDSILKLLGGLQLQLSAAQSAGNNDLVQALQCAQQNAQKSAEGTMQSVQPVMVLLSLAGAFLELANVKLDISIPAAVPADDLAAMQSMLDDIGAVAKVIKEVAEAMPC